jgi:hypothetical protein
MSGDNAALGGSPAAALVFASIGMVLRTPMPSIFGQIALVGVALLGFGGIVLVGTVLYRWHSEPV